jgi:hypothetical protein
MTKIAGPGSGSGSISQRHGSADPDQDPHQNVMDPRHCLYNIEGNLISRISLGIAGSNKFFVWLLPSHELRYEVLFGSVPRQSAPFL